MSNPITADLFSRGAPQNMFSFKDRPGAYPAIPKEAFEHAIKMAKIPESEPFGRKPATDIVYNTAKATSFGKRPYAIVAPSINEATAIAQQTEEQNPFERNGRAAGNAILNASVTQKAKTAKTIAFEDKVKDAVDVVLKMAQEAVALSAIKAGFFAKSCGQETRQQEAVEAISFKAK